MPAAGSTTILALETSCDETAAAVITGAPGGPTHVLSSEIASQIDLHRAYGGVVPELASRNHSLHLRPLVEAAAHSAGVALRHLDAFAATSGPGLASALLVGATAAKGLAAAARKPFLAINHLEGHLLSPFIQHDHVPPHIGLIISGGHTLLLEVESPASYRKLGSTRDDAAGEAFDKVAKMLGLPYPGGPEIERTATTGNPETFSFPRSMLRDPRLDFSFSGLKTAVLYTLTELDPAHGTASTEHLPDLCASFQEAVIDVLIAKTLRAAQKTGHRTIALSGGVSLNGALRRQFRAACQREGITLHLADPAHCADNAVMIAHAARHRFQRGESSPLEIDINPNLPLVPAEQNSASAR